MGKKKLNENDSDFEPLKHKQVRKYQNHKKLTSNVRSRKNNFQDIKDFKDIKQKLYNDDNLDQKRINIKSIQVSKNEQNKLKDKLILMRNQIEQNYKKFNIPLKASLTQRIFRDIIHTQKTIYMSELGIKKSDAVRRNLQRKMNRQINKILQLGLDRQESQRNLNGFLQILSMKQGLKDKVKNEMKDFQQFVYKYFQQNRQLILSKQIKELKEQNLQIIQLLRLQQRLLFDQQKNEKIQSSINQNDSIQKNIKSNQDVSSMIQNMQSEKRQNKYDYLAQLQQQNKFICPICSENQLQYQSLKLLSGHYQK